MLLKLRTKAENWTSSPNHSWYLHIADVTMSSPAFANTFVSGSFVLQLAYYWFLLLIIELIVWINKTSSPPIAKSEMYWIGLMLSLLNCLAKFPLAKISNNVTIISFFLLFIVLLFFFVLLNPLFWKSKRHIKLENSDK